MTPRISLGVTTIMALVVPASGNVTKKLAIETQVRASSALGEKPVLRERLQIWWLQPWQHIKPRLFDRVFRGIELQKDRKAHRRARKSMLLHHIFYLIE